MRLTKAMEEREKATGNKWKDEGEGYYSLIGMFYGKVAYIALPKGHRDIGKDYDEICTEKTNYGPNVNGGLTFSDENVFGWDYAHAFNSSTPENDIPKALKWFKDRKTLIFEEANDFKKNYHMVVLNKKRQVLGQIVKLPRKPISFYPYSSDMLDEWDFWLSSDCLREIADKIDELKTSSKETYTKEDNKYKKKHAKGPELPMRVMKYLVDNIEIAKVGQGILGLKCSRFWDMSNEEFEAIFGVQIKEDSSYNPNNTQSGGKN